MDFYGWRPYVPVAQRRANAQRALKRKLDGNARPVVIDGRKIAKTFWGHAWCENLESYSDFSNRLPRGRTYVRNGSVVHLEIAEGSVRAFVAGSELYEVKIKIDALKKCAWSEIKARCAGQVGSLVELLQGKLSSNTLAIITDRESGLFPAPGEIKLSCSCPDWAGMCKHVAAALYGVGAQLDVSPELFFKLRGVDHLELLSASAALPSGKRDAETLDEASLSDIFGVELADVLDPLPGDAVVAATPSAGRPPAKTAKKKARTAKKTAKKAAKKAAGQRAAKKAVKKAVKKAAKKLPKKAVMKSPRAAAE